MYVHLGTWACSQAVHLMPTHNHYIARVASIHTQNRDCGRLVVLAGLERGQDMLSTRGIELCSLCVCVCVCVFISEEHTLISSSDVHPNHVTHVLQSGGGGGGGGRGGIGGGQEGIEKG